MPGKITFFCLLPKGPIAKHLNMGWWNIQKEAYSSFWEGLRKLILEFYATLPTEMQLCPILSSAQILWPFDL